jgi:uncharacterized membrane protein YecN with MAPEG domain
MAQVYKRSKTFSSKYMRRFEEIHAKEVGGKPPAMGYPDNGNGRYSEDLAYDEWYSFQNWQRTQYNFLEQLTPALIWILIGSNYQPLASAIFGFTYFLGRLLYSIGYCKSPKHRLVGAILQDLAYIAAFVLSIVAIAKWNTNK